MAPFSLGVCLSRLSIGLKHRCSIGCSFGCVGPQSVRAGLPHNVASLPDAGPPASFYQIAVGALGAAGVVFAAWLSFLSHKVTGRAQKDTHKEDLTLQYLKTLIETQDNLIDDLRDENERLWRRADEQRSALDLVRSAHEECRSELLKQKLESNELIAALHTRVSDLERKRTEEGSVSLDSSRGGYRRLHGLDDGTDG